MITKAECFLLAPCHSFVACSSAYSRAVIIWNYKADKHNNIMSNTTTSCPPPLFVLIDENNETYICESARINPGTKTIYNIIQYGGAAIFGFFLIFNIAYFIIS